MTRYYFDVFNDEITLDEEGQELPDREAAVARARFEARVLAGDSVVQQGHLVLDHHIRVRSPDGDIVASVNFGDVIEVR